MSGVSPATWRNVGKGSSHLQTLMSTVGKRSSSSQTLLTVCSSFIGKGHHNHKHLSTSTNTKKDTQKLSILLYLDSSLAANARKGTDRGGIEPANFNLIVRVDWSDFDIGGGVCISETLHPADHGRGAGQLTSHHMAWRPWEPRLRGLKRLRHSTRS